MSTNMLLFCACESISPRQLFVTCTLGFPLSGKPVTVHLRASFAEAKSFPGPSPDPKSALHNNCKLKSDVSQRRS